jgi:hypothetical protein
MGIFDRFRPVDETRGRTYEGQRVEPSEDEQALARYRYMLKTAPPETIEQAHVEAFARLTPPQRRALLEQLRAEMPEAERAYATENPQALAQLATRAEVRQPGTMERLFGGIPAAGTGFGGMMASSLLGSIAGTVLGTMIAQNFLGSHGLAGSELGHAPGMDPGHDTVADTGDMGGGFDDFGSGFDGGSIDV